MRIAPGYLKVKRNETIAWVSREQNYLYPAKLSSWDQIFAAQSVPEITFCPVLEQIVRKYNPGETRLVVTPWLESEFQTVPLAEVSAQKCANPRASAFRHRKNDDFPARKCTGTAAKVTPCPSRGCMPKSRARDELIRGRKSGKRSGRTLIVNGWLFRVGPGQRLRCYFDRHSARAAERYGYCIRTQNGVLVQA
jgi:hypothetical protein